MGKITIYLPDELERQAREAGISMSPVCQKAIKTEVKRMRRKEEGMTLILRQFSYLDSELTTQFLAQLEGGVADAVSIKERQEGKKGARGGIGLGVPGLQIDAGGGKESVREDEAARTIRQTPESDVARFIELLEAAGALIRFDKTTPDEWDALPRYGIVEVESTLTVSALSGWVAASQSLGPLMDMMKSMGETIPEDTQRGMEMLASIGQLTGSKVPVVARIASSPEFKLVAVLDASKIQDVGDLDGEATLLAKIQRKLKDDETYSVVDSMDGLTGLPRELRGELASSLTEMMPDAVVGSPAAIVTPIAVYR